MVATDDSKLQELKSYMDICKEKEYPDSQLIAILHKAQELYGYVKQETMDEVAVYMNIPTAHIWGVATFYHYFNLKPVGKHIVSVCLGTACYVKGAGKILDAVKRHLKIEVGDTTEDKIFTLQEARCLGACGIAPVIMIDEKIYGELNEAKTIELLKKYAKK